MYNVKRIKKISSAVSNTSILFVCDANLTLIFVVNSEIYLSTAELLNTIIDSLSLYLLI